MKKNIPKRKLTKRYAIKLRIISKNKFIFDSTKIYRRL